MTIAGIGTGGLGGDGGPAFNAQLGDLYGCQMAIDGAGNIYIAHSFQNLIRKIDAAGIIHTIAGTAGVLGYSGDGGPATAARVYHPGAMVADNMGGVLFTDQNGCVLRRIDAAGIISTVCLVTNGVASGDGGPLSSARFVAISGLSRDNAGNIYVADAGENTIRKISAAGIVTTVAGNHTEGFSGDGGPATAAQLSQPFQVGVDNLGNIYIPDCKNNRVRKVNPAGIISTIAGDGTQAGSGDGGPAALATLEFPSCICTDNVGNVYIAEPYRNVVRKIDATGNISRFAGIITPGYSGDGGPSNLAQLNEIMGITTDNTGNLYIVDYFNFVIRKVSNCLTPSISLQPKDVPICSLDNAVFTMNASNKNTLQWQVSTGAEWHDLTDNGTYSGTGTNILTITGESIAMDGYRFRCATFNACGPLASATAILHVTDPVTPSISIATAHTSVCTADNVLFTASTLYEGGAPSYQWMKNGADVGSGNLTYSDNNLQDGDQITCRLTRDNTCVTTATTTSNSLLMGVNPSMTAAISISPSANNVCAGTTITFNSAATHEGANPIYEWYKNGVQVGANNPSYTDNGLQNSDKVYCNLLSSAGCLTSPLSGSNTITLNIIPLVAPSISIVSANTRVCPGIPVDFKASIANGGSSPGYQWQKNGIPVGNNTTEYTDVNPTTGDIVDCWLSSNAACTLTSSVNSNAIPITVYANPVVTLDPSPNLCKGSSKLLDAGNFETFLWNDGSKKRTLSVNSPGTYSVAVSDKNGCPGNGSTIISTLMPAPGNFLPGDTTLCTYGSLSITAQPGYNNYLWNDNSTGASITIRNPGLYWVEATDDNYCKGRDSILVGKKDCMQGFFIPNAFTPNHDGKNDLFRPQLFGNIKKYHFAIFNRWGQAVFESTDPEKGWDGSLAGSKQEANVFVWVCSYQFDGESSENKKGTVLLIR